MRVAFTHLPVAGHVNPTLALTRELVGRGVEVVAFASGPVVEDLTAARDRLSERFPTVRFVLAEPLGRHPLLIQVIEEQARDAEPA